MSIEFLSRQNPWWVDKQSIYQDPYISEFESSPVKWFPDCLDKVNLTKDGVYIILGPRQVGKTTSFKLLIKNLLTKEEVGARNILYLNCDEIAPRTPQMLSEHISEYLSC